MGNRNPGRYRKEGREAFSNGELLENCPYIDVPFSPRKDWVEGWEQAEKLIKWNQQQKLNLHK